MINQEIMLHNPSIGKIIIHLEKELEKVNSTMELRGIAKDPEITLTTLLINFASLSLKEGKDPKKLIKKYFPLILEMLTKIGSNKNKEGGGQLPPPFR